MTDTAFLKYFFTFNSSVDFVYGSFHTALSSQSSPTNKFHSWDGYSTINIMVTYRKCPDSVFGVFSPLLVKNIWL